MNQYKKKYYSEKKLLFIFDGIDELNQQSEKNIIDFIPNVDDLIDGVYVLVTCRACSEETLSISCRQFLNNFKGEVCFFKQTDEDYLKFVKNFYDLYIIKKSRLFCKRNGIVFEAEFDKTDEKFHLLRDKSILNLSLIKELISIALKELVESGATTISIDDLNFDEKLYEQYFESIKQYAGLDELMFNNYAQSEFYFKKAVSIYDQNINTASMQELYDYVECLGKYATLLWDQERNDEALAVYDKVIKYTKVIYEIDKSLISKINLLSEYICYCNIANSAKQYDIQKKYLEYVSIEIKDCEASNLKQRTEPFLQLCWFYYYRDANDIEKSILSVKQAIDMYSQCARHDVGMYLPDLVKSYNFLLQYVYEHSVAIPSDIQSYIEKGDIDIDYIHKEKDYNDEETYLKFHLLCSLIYLRQNNLPLYLKYKKIAFTYFETLSDEKRNNAKLIEMINEIKGLVDELSGYSSCINKAWLKFFFARPASIDHVNLFYANVRETFDITNQMESVKSELDRLTEYTNMKYKLFDEHSKLLSSKRKSRFDLISFLVAAIISFVSIYDTFIKMIKNFGVELTIPVHIALAILFMVACFIVPTVINFYFNIKKMRKISKEIIHIESLICENQQEQYF